MTSPKCRTTHFNAIILNAYHCAPPSPPKTTLSNYVATTIRAIEEPTRFYWLATLQARLASFPVLIPARRAEITEFFVTYLTLVHGFILPSRRYRVNVTCSATEHAETGQTPRHFVSASRNVTASPTVTLLYIYSQSVMANL